MNAAILTAVVPSRLLFLPVILPENKLMFIVLIIVIALVIRIVRSRRRR